MNRDLTAPDVRVLRGYGGSQDILRVILWDLGRATRRPLLTSGKMCRYVVEMGVIGSLFASFSGFDDLDKLCAVGRSPLSSPARTSTGP
jgi:hypothetical protein